MLTTSPAHTHTAPRAQAAIAAIRATKDLPRPPYPTLPNLNAPGSMQNKVLAVQTYIEKLQYNFTGVNYFDIRKNRPMTRILETAREITRQALPIKCVEAVFLGCYLTQGLRDLERVPISFKSQVDGNTYKHIVLAVKHNSKWGAIGLSRRRELYYKELTFESLRNVGVVLQLHTRRFPRAKGAPRALESPSLLAKGRSTILWPRPLDTSASCVACSVFPLAIPARHSRAGRSASSFSSSSARTSASSTHSSASASGCR